MTSRRTDDRPPARFRGTGGPPAPGRPPHGAVIRAVAAVAAAVALAGCAAEAPERTELTRVLESTGMAAPLAACVTDAVFDNLPEEDIERIMERGSSGAPVDDVKVDGEPLDRFRTDLQACRAEAAQPEG